MSKKPNHSSDVNIYHHVSIHIYVYGLKTSQQKGHRYGIFLVSVCLSWVVITMIVMQTINRQVIHHTATSNIVTGQRKRRKGYWQTYCSHWLIEYDDTLYVYAPIKYWKKYNNIQLIEIHKQSDIYLHSTFMCLHLWHDVNYH